MQTIKKLVIAASVAAAFYTPAVFGQQSTRMTDAIADLARKPIVVTASEGPEPAVLNEEKEVQRLLAVATVRIPVQQGSLATAIEVTASAAGMNFIAPPAEEFPEIITISVNMNPYRLLLQLSDQYRFTMRFQDGVWRFSREAAGALVARTYRLKHTNLDSFTAKQNTVQSMSSGSSDSSSGSGSGGSRGLSGSTGHVFDVNTKKIIEDIKELIGLPSTSIRAVVAKADEQLPDDEGKRPVPGGGREGPKDNGTRILYLPNANTLYVVATRSQHDYVDAYLKQVDQVEKQVRIVARFVQTTHDPKEIIGIDPTKFQPEIGLSSLTSPMDLNKLSATRLPSNAILSSNDLALQLNALKQESDAKLVNSPDVTTTNNREVYMSVGTEEPFLESNTTNLGTGLGSSQAKIAYRRIGTTVNVTPTVFDDEAGKESIRLIVQVEVAKLTGFRSINGIDVPVVASEKYLYTVFVPNGNTLAFGGFSGLEESTVVNGVPGISRVPVLGWLFKSRSKTMVQKNLVAYITPTIVKPSDYTVETKQ